MIDLIIIGAGASGLYLAHVLNQMKSNPQLLILEKSRGIGGRMATRRTLGTRFDHGAQFYRLKEDSKDLHEKWSEENLSHLWFKSELGEHWCAKEGMTSLAKMISKKFHCELEKQIQKIEKTSTGYKLTSDKNESWECKTLVLTAPLPQALILLDKSHIQYPEEYKNIAYTKALIGLVTLKSKLHLNQFGYIEPNDDTFFSISDQESKGVSSIHALTITMSPTFSETYFDEVDENLVIEKIKSAFVKAFPDVFMEGIELKKWRYCQSLTKANSMFGKIDDNFYLIGDAFGGSSLLGAMRSAKALANQLNSKT